MICGAIEKPEQFLLHLISDDWVPHTMIDNLVWIIGVPVIVVLIVLVIRRAIALKAAIAQHFEDEENGPKDPYAQMAAAMNVQAAIEAERRRAKQARQLLRGGKADGDKTDGRAG